MRQRNAKMAGPVPGRGAWNSIVEFEDKKPAANKTSSGTKLAASKHKKLRELDASDRQIRFSTGLSEASIACWEAAG